MKRKTAGGATAGCGRCGGAGLLGPFPVRTSAHPNSSFVLVETPGAHFHDHPLQALVCPSCGAAVLRVSPESLPSFLEESRPAAPRRRGAARKGT